LNWKEETELENCWVENKVMKTTKQRDQNE
jgi:hypothetical protein